MTGRSSFLSGSPFTRRRFVQGAVAAASALSLSPLPPRGGLAAPTRASVLSGTEFQLEIGPVPINITGRRRTATGINGQVPAPILRWREGDRITLAVTNRLSEPSSIHWHGVRTPSPMDGVPGLSFHGIAPGETFIYRFPVQQNGTYWYHSHRRIGRVALAAPAIVDQPQQCIQYVDEFSGQGAVVFAGLGPVLQRPG